MTDATTIEAFEQATGIAGAVARNVETVVLGKDDAVTLVMAALACRGHVLLEDVPGTAKTVLARAIAASIDGAAATASSAHRTCSRRTSRALDLESAIGVFEFRPGPVSRTCARRRNQPGAAEGAVRAARGDGGAAGHRRRRHPPLPAPFFLIATENPIEQEGTFPLPEAQLDRFFCARRSATRLTRSCRSSTAGGAGTRSAAPPGGHARGARRRSSRRSRTSTSTRC